RVEVPAGGVGRVELRLDHGAVITGRVLRGEAPAAGCLVLDRAPTGPDGSFRLTGVSRGRRYVWARCGNEEGGGERVDTSEGDVSGLIIRLQPLPEHAKGNDFGGVGMSLREIRGRVVVTSVFEGGPGFLAGVRTGDELLAV